MVFCAGRVDVHDSLRAVACEMSACGKDIAFWSLSQVDGDLNQVSQSALFYAGPVSASICQVIEHKLLLLGRQR